jgi:hypothetical protein
MTAALAETSSAFVIETEPILGSLSNVLFKNYENLQNVPDIVKNMTLDELEVSKFKSKTFKIETD